MRQREPNSVPTRVISGGQTGVDQGALRAALLAEIEHGGWCPRGRLAENGVIPARFKLTETASPDYAQRTEKNVIAADGTLILHRGPLTGGTKLTHRLAQSHGKPMMAVDLAAEFDVSAVRRWIEHEHIEVLNVAGPRESTAPGIEAEAYEFMNELLEVDRS